jgi:hypothetical protein
VACQVRVPQAIHRSSGSKAAARAVGNHLDRSARPGQFRNGHNYLPSALSISLKRQASQIS